MPLPDRWLSEVMPRLGRVGVRARAAVEGFLAGAHRSARRGHSVEFAGHRPYLAGDDVRRIDWPLWARSDRLDLRLYQEESQLTAMIALDASGSMGYGGSRAKLAAGACLAAALATVLARHGDAVGLALLGGGRRPLLPPSAEPGRLVAVLEALAAVEAAGGGAAGELARLAPRLPRRSLLFVIGDACDDPAALLAALRLARARRCDVRLWLVEHPAEAGFPFAGDVRFAGLEGEDALDLDADRVRGAYLRARAGQLGRLAAACRAAGIGLAAFPADGDLAAVLVRTLSEGADHA